MSRLIDRIFTRCQPCRYSLMLRREEFESNFRSFILKEYGESITDEQLANLVSKRMSRFLENDPVVTEKFDFTLLDGIPVIAGDDVATYASTLPKGTHMDDVVASMAPPFKRFFIEFQGVPNEENFNGWGGLVTTTDDPNLIQQFEEDDGKPRWILYIDTFIERKKGRPFGPVAQHVVGLAEDGTWFRHANGKVWWAGGPKKMSFEPPSDFVQAWGDNVAQLLFPLLLTISFMHCKNVELSTVTPPTRKYRKKRGRNLVRYHVLEIDPIRRVLDKYRKGSQDDLRRALHICRGHFKTFTNDAPLMGSRVGTYWWAPHVRGSKDSGIVLKDYRVRAPSELGKAYREVEDNPPNSERETPRIKDPDSAGRGLAAHNRTQNKIAEIVGNLGFEPRSPRRGEPEYDIAWRIGENVYVCEVKSLTAENEERQLRMAIGQVIRYRQKMTAAGYEHVTAVIASERSPTDQSWEDLCQHENILLIWPDVADNRLGKLVDNPNYHN